MPTLSVVTPSFNQGRFIGRTIDSVLSQGVDLEYVIMDGGSCDETADVARAYEGRLLFVSERDKGQTDALNKGIAVTSGEIIGWLNSDDVYYPGALRAVLDHFAAHPECDVLYGQADHIDEHDAFIEEYPVEPFDLTALEERCIICQPALFFRRRVVGRFGLPDVNLRYCMDYEFWLRLGLAGARFHHLPVKLAGSRFYPDTKTLGQRLPVHTEINRMLADTLGRVPDRWLCNWAHTLLRDTMGFDPARRYTTALIAAAALGASLRWNRTIPASLWRTVKSWL
ncbi:PGL/p-HBAD biosynthesis glycosyltransferase [Fundidesulfovibrio magnetotacticus]|uniref:PGL/p-HBAD biosynthesis glycosyltransferase n=1 Tax=Fundidesulfovibrio magnetotacticus TaxID=2730080 RepID=A0A6V8LNQ3_9BACT|nr:glycosyltransferase family 2 protein [Fundidesulfovibrio magnetotacticus]GFK92630.1 PGL/p-HBAD biosynthesis glycosyltransferase [Fundidesulfovibrio magnetotacticus]